MGVLFWTAAAIPTAADTVGVALEPPGHLLVWVYGFGAVYTLDFRSKSGRLPLPCKILFLRHARPLLLCQSLLIALFRVTM